MNGLLADLSEQKKNGELNQRERMFTVTAIDDSSFSFALVAHG
jgi:hypothetical protein